jgi:glycosyltransferase involved in cell wall biosynthesis
MNQEKIKIAYVGPTPAYYFVPFLKLLANVDNIELTVYWGSDEAARNYKENDFNSQIEVNENLLEGYDYKILNNIIGKESYQNGFWGLNSLDFFKEFYNHKYDVVIIHGWQYLNNIFALIAARLFCSMVLMRAETPLNQELMKPKILLMLKKILLPIIFKLCDKFLYIGKQNKLFYENYGIEKNRLFFTPYSVDNRRFEEYNIKNQRFRQSIRSSYGIMENEVVFLFVGKFIPKKKAILILKAIAKVDKKIKLILVGSGYQEIELRDYVRNNDLSNIIFAGYQPQHIISKYYLISDVFLLPSGIGETWGLVINEALNFGLPIISSDVVGSSDDLCTKNNGFIFKSDDVDDLSRCISLLQNNTTLRRSMSAASIELIKNYSPSNTVSGIISAIR